MRIITAISTPVIAAAAIALTALPASAAGVGGNTVQTGPNRARAFIYIDCPSKYVTAWGVGATTSSLIYRVHVKIWTDGTKVYDVMANAGVRQYNIADQHFKSSAKLSITFTAFGYVTSTASAHC